MVTIREGKNFVTPQAVAGLYVELGWGTAKKYSIARMRRSLKNCDIVVSAWNEAGELVGISRALTDHALETKILDLVIVPEYQRQGLGQKMMRKIASLARGTTLYCETEQKNFGFVAKCGYKRRKGLAVFTKKG